MLTHTQGTQRSFSSLYIVTTNFQRLTFLNNKLQLSNMSWSFHCDKIQQTLLGQAAISKRKNVLMFQRPTLTHLHGRNGPLLYSDKAVCPRFHCTTCQTHQWSITNLTFHRKIGVLFKRWNAGHTHRMWWSRKPMFALL
jgi:hypothetical protein